MIYPSQCALQKMRVRDSEILELRGRLTTASKEDWKTEKVFETVTESKVSLTTGGWIRPATQHNTETQLEALRVCVWGSGCWVLRWDNGRDQHQRSPLKGSLPMTHSLFHSPGWSEAVISKGVSLPLICFNSELESLKGERTAPCFLFSRHLPPHRGQ